MRKTPALVAALAAVTALAGALPATAATPGRAEIGSSHPAWANPKAKVGAANPEQQLTFRVYLRSRDAAGAEAMARAVSDPRSPRFRHALSPAQVRHRFGPTPSAVRGVRHWLRDAGFRLGAMPANGAYVEASGTAGRTQRTFDVRLADYTVQGKRLRGTDRELSVPQAVAGSVLGVVGVDQSMNLLEPQHTTGSAATDARASSDPNPVPPSPGTRNAGPCGRYFGEKVDTGDPRYGGRQLPYVPCGYTPPQLRSAYGIDKAVDAGKDGRGSTVAIIDAFASPTIYSDASSYARRNDPQHPLRRDQFKQLVFPENGDATGPDQCDAAGWYGEETLDVEAVHGMAPGADILYVGGSDCQDSSLDKALNEVVAGRKADIVSNSYGDTGEDIPPASVAAFSQITLQAVLEGIGVYFSSGDSGDEVARLGHPSPDFPASGRWVTAVGGTSLKVDGGGDRTGESGWQTGTSQRAGGAWAPKYPGEYMYGAGGGTSVLFREPFYQRGTVPRRLGRHNQTGGGLGRVVPDLSAVGDPNTGMLVGQTQTFPDGAYYDQYRIGGTSLATPLIAGTMAVSDQVTGYHHGFINPVLYFVTARTPALHDIRHGTGAVARVDYKNGIDPSGGLATTARSLDYDGLTIHTRTGYDDVTGLGTPNGPLFLHLS